MNSRKFGFLNHPERQFPVVLCFTADVFFSTRDLRAPSADRRETLPCDQRVLVFYNPQIFGALPPKKLGPKHVKFRSISDHFKVRSRISPERIKISKIGKRMCRQQFLPRSAKKKSSELWSTNNKDLNVHFDPPKSTFSEDHISAPRGALPAQIFTRA